MIVMSGASGKLGRAAAAAFAALGAADRVVLGSRTPAALSDLAAQGFGTVAFDFDDPAGMQAAFAGAETAILISGDAPNAVAIAQQARAVDAAKAAGVAHIIYTSIAAAKPGAIFEPTEKHVATEAHLAASGLKVTLLRNTLYADNLADPLTAAQESGVFALAGAVGRTAYATRADMGRAIAHAALTPAAQGKVWEITGPEALNAADIARIAAQVWGREVTSAAIPLPDLEAGLRAAGLPDFVVTLVLSLWQATDAGEFEAVTGDLEQLIGQRPETMRDYIAAHFG